MRQSKRFLKVLACFLLALLLPSSGYLYAEETYLISESELTKLMDNLEASEMELANQKQLVIELQNSLMKEQELSLTLKTNYDNLEKQQMLLQNHLLDSQNELKKAQDSLTVLKSEVSTSLNRQMWIGIGVGALVGVLLGGGIATAIAISI